MIADVAMRLDFVFYRDFKKFGIFSDVRDSYHIEKSVCRERLKLQYIKFNSCDQYSQYIQC